VYQVELSILIVLLIVLLVLVGFVVYMVYRVAKFRKEQVAFPSASLGIDSTGTELTEHHF
jgi:flagellar basal body-associated protein FliL